MSQLEIILRAQPATFPAPLPARPHRRHDYTGWMQAHPPLGVPQVAPNELADLFGHEVFQAAPEPPRPPQVVPEGYHMIGDLAKAMGKKPHTIHQWIKKGYLPEAPTRTRGPTYAGGLHGTITNAKRLWPAEEIDAIAEIAHDEGVMGDFHGLGGVAATNFVIRVQDAIAELRSAAP